MAVSKRLRYEVLRRDGHRCRYCGVAAPDVKLTVDHVIPTALGGQDEPGNLVAACGDCNAGKTSSSADAALVADVDSRAVRWARAMKLAIEQRAVELAADRQRTDAFDAAWSSWRTADGEPVPREANWRNSVLRFLAGGLGDQFLLDAVQTAMGNSRVRASETWRYFCGICWREMDGIREIAAGLADGTSKGAAAAPSAPGCSEVPLMELFDSFLDEVVDALGGDQEARRLANRALWACFPSAHCAYSDWEAAAGPHGEEDCEALEAAREELANQAAPYMCQMVRTRYPQLVTT